ncbi:MAG: pantoate--beta-alanine ligase, partial [Alphaproteobacteria bacterium]|nr:pantoate--beta-alanine ligase [Alphaproteobacteria bacterium]
MQTVNNLEALKEALSSLRKRNESVALVPTMGALHAGHLALVDCARTLADRIIVTIFVNPKQFSAGEDFDAYPRDIAGDAEKLRAAGADLVWIPDADLIYPPGYATSVRVARLSETLCGPVRPGHFA